MKEKIINELAREPFYKDLCYRYCGGDELWEDLYQFIFLSLLEMKEERLVEIYNANIKGYISRMVWINWVSPTSPFRRMYDFDFVPIEEHISPVDDSNYEEVLIAIQQVEQEFKIRNDKKKMYNWQHKVFEQYVELGSMHKVAVSFGISYSTIRHNLSLIIKAINERITANNRKTYRY